MFRFSRLSFSAVGLGLSKLHHYHLFLLRNCSALKEEKDTSSLQPSNSLEEEESIAKKIAKTNVFLEAEDISDLLKIATANSNFKNAFKALEVMTNWQGTKKISFNEIEKDANFEKFLDVLDKGSRSQPEREITKAIEHLTALGVPSNHFLIETLENDLLWNVTRVSLGSLLHIASFQSRHQETERQKKVLDLALLEIKRCWTALRNPYEYFTLYSLSNHFDKNLLGQVDERLIDHIENMKVKDLSRIFVAIGASKRRPTPLLRSLAFHMFKKNEPLHISDIVNVMYAMNALSFVDESLLVKLSGDFLTQIEDLKELGHVRGFLRCMGQMKWREKAVLNAVSDWMIKNIEICQIHDIVSIILTLAAVNYKPDNFEDLISLCVSKLDFDSISDKSILIDIVWSLTILGKASNYHVSRVLSHSFANQELSTYFSSKVGLILKLLNINAAANTLMESYEGERLKPSFFDTILLTMSRRDIKLNEHIYKILHNILPPPKYIKENVNTDMGFTVDAEIILDKQNRPLIVSDYSTAFGSVESPVPLPEGGRRIALMIWGYKDYTVGDQGLLGKNQLAVELLEKRGYKVAQVPYYDINRKDKTVKSIRYFESKFKNL